MDYKKLCQVAVMKVEFDRCELRKWIAHPINIFKKLDQEKRTRAGDWPELAKNKEKHNES